MSSAKSGLAKAGHACNPSTSATPTTSNGGATTTPSASSIHCCTPTSNATPQHSGNPALAAPATADCPTLLATVTAPGYVDRVCTAVEGVAEATDVAAAQFRLAECVATLGVESACFANLVRDGTDIASCRFMLACDPGWFQRRLAGRDLARDPWLCYAIHHAEPILASDPTLCEHCDASSCDPAFDDDFASAFLVPVQSGPGHSRVSLLILGSPQAGYFEAEGLARFRLGARALAGELHDWWLARRRLELLVQARITPLELELLRHERLGHGSKHIARVLRSSEGAIDSRFQRLNAKLGTPNRRAAAHLVVECRLLPF